MSTRKVLRRDSNKGKMTKLVYYLIMAWILLNILYDIDRLSIKALALFGLLAGHVDARLAARASPAADELDSNDHLDLEVVVEGGRRELFPLLPGTKCPAGHKCRARNNHKGMAPLMSSLKDNMKEPLKTPQAYHEMNQNLNTAVESDDYCTRRSAMARAAGLAAGLAVSTVNSPAYAAETKTVMMGSDSGQLVFVPAMLKICKGDSVKW